MNELKRYTMRVTDMGIRACQCPDGMWCRYRDVARILRQLSRQNERPMTNEELVAALAKLQNEANSYKAQAKADAKAIKSLKQECVRLRNRANREHTLRMRERGLRTMGK